MLALSSGESELGGLVKAFAEGLGLQAILKDFGVSVHLKVLSDASAAIGMVRRLGLGKVRHLATADLWIQQRVRDGSVCVSKCPGALTCSDLMTKYKSRQDLLRQTAMMGFRQIPGRPSISPMRTSGWTVDKPVSAPAQTRGNVDVDHCGDLHLLGGGSLTVVETNSLHTTFLEGRRLCSEFPLPPRSDRLLLSVLDMNSGEWVYDGWNGDGTEPNLLDLVKDDHARPWLLSTWVIVTDHQPTSDAAITNPNQHRSS